MSGDGTSDRGFEIPKKTNVVDLRVRPAGVPAHTYAFHALKSLGPGEEVLLISSENPQLVMVQVQHQLRHRLSWAILERGDPFWSVRVRNREESEPEALLDILSRDHVRLDKLLVRATERLRQDGRAAVPAVREFMQSLRRHIRVENDVIAPLMPSGLDADSESPVTTMRREHEDILKQAEIIEEIMSRASPDPLEAETWFSLLSATLAKHEHREETRLLPLWDAHLRKLDDTVGLIERVKQELAPDEG